MIAVLLNGSPDQRAAMVEFVTSHFHREEDPGYGRVFLNDGFDVGLYIPQFLNLSVYEIFEHVTAAQRNGYDVLIPEVGFTLSEFFPTAARIDMSQDKYNTRLCVTKVLGL